MDHYLEIRLLPDPEFVPTVLMNALFAKLHRALVDLDANTIGASFPDVQIKPPGLGERMRLHGTDDDLQRLMALNWMTGMRDHTSTSIITPIPANISYRVVRRVQAKSNPERLRRRLIKRKQMDKEAAQRAIPNDAVERLDLPFLTVKSHSSGHRFRLFIDHQPIVSQSANGKFSHYGLSPTATIPWF